MYRILFICILLIAFIYADMSDKDRKEAFYSCLENNASACMDLIEDGLPESSECDTKKTCHIIANIYDNANMQKMALPYYELSCSERIESCFNLAINYEILGEDTKSQMYYKIACDGGFNPACFNLAIIYLDGNKPHLIKRANALLLESCSNNYQESCYLVAMNYRNGIGLKADRLRAKQYLQKACKLNSMKACRELEIINAAEFSITKPSVRDMEFEK